MDFAAIIEHLGYAVSHERPVRIILHDAREIAGIPTSLDAARGATEVFLTPAGDPDTEIADSLGEISRVDLT